MSSDSGKPSVDRLRKIYEEHGASAVADVQRTIEEDADLKTILEDNSLSWPETDAGVTGTGGFFDKLEEDAAQEIVNYFKNKWVGPQLFIW